MPIPTVVCRICGQQVTRRMTLSLQVLGAGEGRACRKHEDVERLIQDLENKTRDIKEARKGLEIAVWLQVLALASAVRYFHSVFRFPTEEMYFHINANIGSKFAQAVREEVTKQGGPQLTPQEIGDATISAIWMAERKREIGL